MKVQKSLVKRCSLLLWLAIFFAFLKLLLPASMATSFKHWTQNADTNVPNISNLLADKPRIRVSKKRMVVSKGSYQGTVHKVHDGDTVHILDINGHMHKVRLANMDAPELNQAYGIASREALKNRIDGQQVDVQVMAIDQYRREVGQIRLNNVDINLWMVQQGLAWHYASIAKKQQSKFDFNRYQQTQLQAQQNRLGLWHNARAIPPWQFRQQQKVH